MESSSKWNNLASIKSNDTINGDNSTKETVDNKNQDDIAQKLHLREDLKDVCEIYTQGAICLANGSRIISQMATLDKCIGSFYFDEKIVKN